MRQLVQVRSKLANSIPKSMESLACCAPCRTVSTAHPPYRALIVEDYEEFRKFLHSLTVETVSGHLMISARSSSTC